MIKLKKLTFEGFRTEQHIASVEFSEDLISVIYGDNGSGKTTYLKAIHAFFSQDSAYLESISVQAINCEYFYDEVNEVFDEDNNLIEQTVIAENLLGNLRIEKKEGHYDWEAFEQSPLIKTQSLSLGVERGIATQQLRIEPELLLNYFIHPRNRGSVKGVADRSDLSLHQLAEGLSRYIRTWQANSHRSRRSEIKFDSRHVNLQDIKLNNIEQILVDRYRFAREFATEQIQDALFNTLAVAISGEHKINKVSKSDFVSALKDNHLRLLEALEDNSKNEFKNSIITKLKNLEHDGAYDAVYDKELLRELLWNMLEKLKFEKLLLSSINLLTEKFNNYLIDDKVLKILDDRAFVEVSGRELPLSDLSSGERHILTFLTLVLFQGRQRNFLIIDEPEISLNIKWQRDLMGLLNNLAPNTQIIVASHSPALAKRKPEYLTELKVVKGLL